MLKVRVIPTLLWKDTGLVKGVGFDSWRRVGAVMPAIKVYNTREVDELILLDITATKDNREPDYSAISDFTSECFVPLTFGGGVRNIETIREVLKAGADKVAVNSAAYENPELLREASALYGSQCIVSSIDYRRRADGIPECYSNCGTRATGRDVVSWAKQVEALGAGEILLTSIERDGTMQGYDLELLKKVTSAVHIPVIASGGAGEYAHMHDALEKGGASSVAAAAIFHFTQQTPLEAKKYLASHDVIVRGYSFLKSSSNPTQRPELRSAEAPSRI